MRLKLTIAIFAAALSALAGDKYPLTMTATFTEGKMREPARELFHADGYDCTDGDEHNGPVCRTPLEWDQMNAVGGRPDVVVFTLADGAVVGVHSLTVKKNKIPGYIECFPAVNVTFCALYFEMSGKTLVDIDAPAGYGQTVRMSAEEMVAAFAAVHRTLFGDGNVMTARFRYRLKGKAEKDGFQHIEVDPSDCHLSFPNVSLLFGVHLRPCDADVHLMNPRGDGYYTNSAH
jgi:hypothetical protein